MQFKALKFRCIFDNISKSCGALYHLSVYVNSIVGSAKANCDLLADCYAPNDEGVADSLVFRFLDMNEPFNF